MFDDDEAADERNPHGGEAQLASLSGAARELMDILKLDDQDLWDAYVAEESAGGALSDQNVAWILSRIRQIHSDETPSTIDDLFAQLREEVGRRAVSSERGE